MKYPILILFFLLACNSQQQQKDKTRPLPGTEINEIDIYSQLENHFNKRKIDPFIILNNVGFQQNDLELENHKVQFIDSDDEITIQIDGDIFSLKDKTTLNNVTDDEPGSVDFVNTWQQARLYKHYLDKERDIILLNLVYSPCTGFGCSVEFTLIYDCTTKAKSFFGSFRGTNTTELFNYNGKLSYISNTFVGDYHGQTPVELIKHLYTLQKNGSFTLENTPDGGPYFIKHTIFPQSTKRKDELKEHWIEKVVK